MKKYRFLLFLIAIICSINTVLAQQSNNLKLDTPVEVKEFQNLYKSGNYFFGGQPTYEMLKWLKREGVTLVVNLRTKDENTKFSKSAFDEKNLLTELDIEYTSIPVSYPDSYNPETLSKFSKVLSEHKGKVFIHCASGGRVKTLFMAYLVNTKGYSLDEAFRFGKQMDYFFPLEGLLGKEIALTLKE